MHLMRRLMRLTETATPAQAVIAKVKQAFPSLVGDSVGIELEAVSDQLVEIEHIYTDRSVRRQGLATKALEFVIQCAIEHHVKLRLYVDPNAGADSMSPEADELQAWYNKLGFSWDDGDGMVLEPW